MEMYISNTTLFIALAIIFIVWYYKKTSSNKSYQGIADHFTEKYKKTIEAYYGYRNLAEELSKLVSDMSMILIIQALIKDDPDRYEQLTKKGKITEEAESEFESWIANSESKEIYEAREIRNMNREIGKKLDSLETLHSEFAPEYVKSKNGTAYELSLDDIMGAFIYTNAFYEVINQKKYLHTDGINLKNFTEEYERLMKQLEEIEVTLQDRFYNIA